MKFKKYLPQQLLEGESLYRSREFLSHFLERRSVRDFSPKDVPFEIIKNIVMTAASAPSGANKQPWKFVIVKDPEVKKQIRIAAEAEEKENYERRFPDDWLEDLNQFGTDWQKEFLETAPYLIIIFKVSYEMYGGKQKKNYYVNESCGIATGFLLTAIHNAGLTALTHTPSPMNFLQKILNRPLNEKPYLLIPVGYAAENAEVPVLNKKSFEEVSEVV